MSLVISAAQFNKNGWHSGEALEAFCRVFPKGMTISDDPDERVKAVSRLSSVAPFGDWNSCLDYVVPDDKFDAFDQERQDLMDKHEVESNTLRDICDAERASIHATMKIETSKKSKAWLEDRAVARYDKYITDLRLLEKKHELDRFMLVFSTLLSACPPTQNL